MAQIMYTYTTIIANQEVVVKRFDNVFSSTAYEEDGNIFRKGCGIKLKSKHKDAKHYYKPRVELHPESAVYRGFEYANF